MTLGLRVTCGAALLLLAGCGGSDDEGPRSPLNEEQAAKRVDELVTEASRSLPDSVELEALGPSVTAPCENEDLVTVTKTYWLRGLEAEDNEEHVEALHEYWESNGYTIVEDQRPDDLFIHVRHDEDKFSMSVTVSKQGSLSLGASSPCIDENGADG